MNYQAGFTRLFHKLACAPAQTSVLIAPHHPTAAALEKVCAALKIPGQNIRRGDFFADRPALYAALDNLFFAGRRPGALGCFSSSPAIAACIYLMSKGLRAPADFQLAAAGNVSDLADLLTPMWVLELPRHAMGLQAGKMIHGILTGQPAEPAVLLDPELVLVNKAPALTA